MQIHTAYDVMKEFLITDADLEGKYKRNNFSLNELEEIAAAVGCNLEITFSDKQGN